MKTRVGWCSWAFVTVLLSPMTVTAEEAYLRVVDVGPGLCIVGQLPGGHHFLYDAGHWHSSQCAAAVAELVPNNHLDLVVISHPDADHLGELPTILSENRASLILTTGARGDSGSWDAAQQAIATETYEGATVLNLQTWPMVPPVAFRLGDSTLTFLAGWHAWDESLSDPSKQPRGGELSNVISIVMRLEYAGKSVLLTGDTIGRRLADPSLACRDAERWMVSNLPTGLLDSDVLIASHHGGNNGSAGCFISAVSPQFVVFSAGHSHRHPTSAAASRFLQAGVSSDHLFRTDVGDDEGDGEWPLGRIADCNDGRGDDDVEIRLPAGPEAAISVNYRTPSASC